MPAAISRAPANVVAVPNFGSGQTGLGRAPCRTRRDPRRGRSPPGLVPTIGTPAAFEPLRQAQRGLSAELHDHPGDGARERLGPVHLEHVLERERLEVQAVGGVVVGGDGLRVAVDHHGLVAGLRQRQCGVDAGVVELDALTDAVRSGAEDQDLRTLGLRGHLGLGRRVEFVRGVVVRRLRLELGGAGVDRLVDGADVPAAHAAPGRRPRRRARGAGPRSADPTGRGAWRGAAPARHLGRLAQPVAELVDLQDLVEEPRVDLRGVEQLLDGGAESERLLEAVDAAVAGDAQFRQEARRGRWPPPRGRSSSPARLVSSERSTLPNASVKLRPMDMASPTDFIVVVRVSSAPGNFSNANRGALTTT